MTVLAFFATFKPPSKVIVGIGCNFGSAPSWYHESMCEDASYASAFFYVKQVQNPYWVGKTSITIKPFSQQTVLLYFEIKVDLVNRCTLAAL